MNNLLTQRRRKGKAAEFDFTSSPKIVISDLLQLRNDNIARNNAFLANIGLAELKEDIGLVVTAEEPAIRRKRVKKTYTERDQITPRKSAIDANIKLKSSPTPSKGNFTPSHHHMQFEDWEYECVVVRKTENETRLRNKYCGVRFIDDVGTTEIREIYKVEWATNGNDQSQSYAVKTFLPSDDISGGRRKGVSLYWISDDLIEMINLYKDKLEK